MDNHLIDKIRALYRLSQDPSNEHEAALAADRVRALLAEHNLSLGKILNEKSEATERAGKYSGRIERHTNFLAHACKHLFDVEWFVGFGGRIRTKGIWGSRHQDRGIVFCGLPQNVEAAIVTMEYFEHAISALLVRRSSIRARRRQNCYRNGAAERIAKEASQLKAAAAAADGPGLALIRIGNAVAKRQIDSHKLNSRPIRKQRVNQAFMDGYVDGGEVNLRGGVQKAMSA